VSDTDRDEFYIGYEGPMPRGVARLVGRAVAVSLLVGLAAAAAFAVSQRPLASARFDYGRVLTFEGFLARHPAPSLLVATADGWERHWLVSRGKFGAARAIGDRRDGYVRVQGTLVVRESWRMIELASADVTDLAHDGPAPSMQVSTPEPVRVRGEIVDSKCFLGVMNPGERIVHRDCAIRCLSGGIPAMFSFRDAQDAHHLALLIGPDDAPAGPALESWTGQPIVVSGSLYRLGAAEVLVLAADPSPAATSSN
jgi:hypothetical protein